MKRFGAAICAVTLLLTLAPIVRAEAVPEPIWVDRFAYVDPFSCGFARVGQNAAFVFVTPKGEQLKVAQEYEGTNSFRGGLAPILYTPGAVSSRMGWIGTDGTVKIPVEYRGVHHQMVQRNTIFAQDLEGNYVTLNTEGEVIAYAPKHMTMDADVRTCNGLIAVRVWGPGQPSRIGFVDRNWNIVVPAQFNYSIMGFREGGACVSMSEPRPGADIPFFFINVQGEQIGPTIRKSDPDWYYLSDGFCGGLLSVRGENGKWGAIDTHGELVIPYEYDRHLYFKSGYSFTVKEQKVQVIDTSGAVIIPEVDMDIDNRYTFEFSEGLASVCKNGKWGYIDITGRQVVPPIYSSALNFSEGYAWVQREDSCWGVLRSPLAGQSDWAKEGIQQAYIYELLFDREKCNFQAPLTRMQAAELTANLAELCTGRPIMEAPASRFTDTKDWMARKAAQAGIVQGTGDGSTFEPNNTMTREQFATMLYRALEYAGIPLEPGDLTGYTDGAEVSVWAKDAVSSLASAGLMEGTSQNTLSPKDTITLEQAILLIVRAYQNA